MRHKLARGQCHPYMYPLCPLNFQLGSTNIVYWLNAHSWHSNVKPNYKKWRVRIRNLEFLCQFLKQKALAIPPTRNSNLQNRSWHAFMMRQAISYYQNFCSILLLPLRMRYTTIFVVYLLNKTKLLGKKRGCHSPRMEPFIKWSHTGTRWSRSKPISLLPSTYSESVGKVL